MTPTTPPFFRERATCRLCASGGLATVLPLEPIPIGSPNLDPPDGEARTVLVPLALARCSACGHLQLSHRIDPALQFSHFRPEAAASRDSRHFARAAELALERRRLPPGALVVEIANNKLDGTFLGCFRERGLRVVGVDPARRTALKTREAGFDTIDALMSPAVAQAIVERHGPAALVVSNNSIANIDDLEELAAGLRTLLAPDGLFVFESFSGAAVIAGHLLDTLYHEHQSYFRLRSLDAFFRRQGLELVDLEVLATKGGTFRAVVQHAGGAVARSPAVAAAIAAEEAAIDLDDDAPFRGFADALAAGRRQVEALVARVRAEGGTVAGYGASIGSIPLLHAFSLSRALSFIADDGPLSDAVDGPGYRIPVLPSVALYQHKPAAVVILAPRFADAICERHRAYLDQGGVFVVLQPTFSLRTRS